MVGFEKLEGILVVMAYSLPTFILPIILGPAIFRFFSKDPLSRVAGLFTIKPLIATPLWALILVSRFSDSHYINSLFGLIPGIGLTLVIVARYYPVMATEKRLALLFLFMDAARWINTFFVIKMNGDLNHPIFLVALILPNAFALVALVIVWFRKRQINTTTQA